MQTKIKLTILIFLCLPLVGCSPADLAVTFNWIMKIGVLVTALAGIGNFYFDNKLKQQEISAKAEFSKQQIIEVGSNHYKEWLVEKDSPIILEAIDVSVNVNFQVYFEKGDSFNVHKIHEWDFGGVNPFVDFQTKWENNQISLSQLKGIVTIPSQKFRVTTAQNQLVYRQLSSSSATYEIKKSFYLTNTSSLPNSKTINNFGNKVANRIFKEEDLINFNLNKFQKFNTLEEIPGQSGQTIKFLLKPKIQISGI